MALLLNQEMLYARNYCESLRSQGYVVMFWEPVEEGVKRWCIQVLGDEMPAKTDEVEEMVVKRGRVEITLRPWKPSAWIPVARILLKAWMLASFPFAVYAAMNYVYIRSSF